MDFDQLRYFVSVAQTLNFTQAARLHYITQPAISRRITELEKELGARLFIRNSHQVELTRAGEEFFRYALAALDSTSAVKQRVHNIASGKEGRIRISAVSTSDQAVNQVLSRFVQRCPNVQIDLDFSTGMAQMAAINKGDYDFYFSFETLLRSSHGLEYLITDTDRFHLFVPNRYACLADGNDFTRLNRLPLVTESRSEGPFLVDQVFALCQARGFDTDNIIPCNDYRTVVAFTNAGMGFTLFPGSIGKSLNTDCITSFPVPGEDAQTVNAIGWDPHSGNNTAAEFLQVIRELYETPPPPSPDRRHAKK